MEKKENFFYTELYKCIRAINIKKIDRLDKEELLKIFKVTDNPLIRNHLALIFSDIQYNEAVPYIINRIMEKDIEDTGTLIYSLGNLDCKKYFLNFIQIICQMDYEARLTAFEIVKKYSPSISKGVRTLALDKLKICKKYLQNSLSDKGESSSLHFVEKTEELLLS